TRLALTQLPRSRCLPRLSRSVRWPARRGGGGRSYPRAWGGWVVQGMWHPGRASVACRRPGTGPLCPRRHALLPTEQRTGADRPKRPRFPVRVSVPGGGGSPRALDGAGTKKERKPTMSTTNEQNKALVRRLWEAMNNRQLEALDDLLAPDVVRHCEATP